MMGINLYSEARLVPFEDHFRGIVRGCGQRDMQRIEGICGDFFIGSNFQNPQHDPELFFYGTCEELELNFQSQERRSRARIELFPQHIVYNGEIRSKDFIKEAPVAKIKLEEFPEDFKLSNPQLVLARELLGYVSSHLNEEELKIFDLRNVDKKSNIPSSFYRQYPSDFVYSALSTGYFLSKRVKVKGKKLNNLLPNNPWPEK